MSELAANQRIEIRDGREFIVTVIPEQQRNADRAVVKTKKASRRRGSQKTQAIRQKVARQQRQDQIFEQGTAKVLKKAKYVTFAEGFAATAAEIDYKQALQVRFLKD